jgi:pyrroline-5-carboxylate reductase
MIPAKERRTHQEPPMETSPPPAKPVLLLIGCGRIGSALLSCALESGIADVAVVEPRIFDISDCTKGRSSPSFAASFATLPDYAESGVRHDYVLFAVKPQQLHDVLAEYAELGLQKDAAVISVAAGAPVALFEGMLGKGVPVIRAMPNIAVACGAGATGYYASPSVSPVRKAFAAALFGHGGLAQELPEERLIDAVTAISGSGPAYFFYFAECLAKAAREIGLPEDAALALANRTLSGAGRMAESDSPSRLREQVTSPGGTTAEALSVLMQGGALERTVSEAVKAALARAKELAVIAGE